MHPVRSKQDSRILNPSPCWDFSKSQSCKECPEMHHLQWTREENTGRKKALRLEWLAWNWTRSLTRGFHFISCYLATTYPSEIPAEEGGGWGLGTIIKVFNIITLPIYTSLQGSRIMVTLCWLETWHYIENYPAGLSMVYLLKAAEGESPVQAKRLFEGNPT